MKSTNGALLAQCILKLDSWFFSSDPVVVILSFLVWCYLSSGASPSSPTLKCRSEHHLWPLHSSFPNRLLISKWSAGEICQSWSPVPPHFHFNGKILMSAVSILVWVAYWLLICVHWLRSQGSLIRFDAFEYIHSSSDVFAPPAPAG